jgi:hypothetical protein
VLLIVEAPGHQSELRYVKVQSGQRVEVDFDLQMKGSEINKRSLTVQPIPPDARVRILNIGARYQPGIRLGPGRYHIEVSKPGYATQLQWAEIADENLNLMIVLAKLQP